MTDQDAFLAAIVDEPENINVRLQYAEWLEERGGERACLGCVNGQSIVTYGQTCANCGGTGRILDGNLTRAEFIRVQCRLAEMEADTKENCRPSWLAQCEREKELLDKHGIDWFQALEFHQMWGSMTKAIDEAGRVHHGGWYYGGDEEDRGHVVFADFRRGFVECISLTAADFLQHGPMLVRATPLTQVRLTDRKPLRGIFSDDPRTMCWFFSDRATATSRSFVADMLGEQWIESELWHLLSPDSKMGHGIYPSEAEALADLSRARLLHARKQRFIGVDPAEEGGDRTVAHAVSPL